MFAPQRSQPSIHLRGRERQHAGAALELIARGHEHQPLRGGGDRARRGAARPAGERDDIVLRAEAFDRAPRFARTAAIVERAQLERMSVHSAVRVGRFERQD